MGRSRILEIMEIISIRNPPLRDYGNCRKGDSMENQYPAHIRTDANGVQTEQTVTAHCRGTARYAADSLNTVGFSSAGYLAGLLHDMGKFTKKFRAYLKKSANGESVDRGSVNHTFCGAVFLLTNYHSQDRELISRMTAELIAYAVGAHHGLFDGISPDGKDGFLHRLNTDKADLCYDEAVSNFFCECAGEDEIDALFQAAKTETQNFINKALLAGNRKKAPIAFSIGAAQRLLLSALIDADRSNTAEFMNNVLYADAGRGGAADWKELLNYTEQKIEAMDTSGDINKARRKISDMCRSFAERPGGIYRLTVPTGAGKTLSTLRYALAHAAAFNKQRVFFIIPLLSVIEQNAGIIRDYIMDSNLVLEHHSNIIRPKQTDGELDRYELLSESWDAPVVISTLVQFLDTLFSDKTACVRRMCALSDSVIVLDEIQSLPKKTINLVNGALNALTQLFGATVVLCSATQPCLENTGHPLLLNGSPDIVPYNAALWSTFKRTEVIDKCIESGYSDEEAADFLAERLSCCESLLMICNTKATAKRLYELLDILNRNSERPCLLFHLSTSMCTKHRADTLDAIRKNLGKSRVVCVSTQLVEAGVDFSFECVVRARAGLDNIAQAAGRCNRSGEFHKLCQVYIINLKSESLGPLREIADAQEAAKSFLYGYSQNSGRFGEDMLSEKSIGEYYRILYADKSVSNKFDYPVPAFHTTLYDMLSVNKAFAERCKAPVCELIRQAFKTAGGEFEVFDENTEDAVVPYDKTAEDLIAGLYSEKAKHDLRFLAETIAKAKPYTVSLFEYQRRALENAGGLHGGGDMPVLTVLPRFYDQKIGLRAEEVIL
jgi:CRISPR-associated helicase Cas3/CRISPR-associated endonuclease Cas3-HD